MVDNPLNIGAGGADFTAIQDAISTAADGDLILVGPGTYEITAALAGFAILFGTRKIDVTEHHDGLMLAVAFESVVKLCAFVAVGMFAWTLLGNVTPAVSPEAAAASGGLHLLLDVDGDHRRHHLFGERGEQEKVWGSMVKQALKRRKPGFSETYHGFRTFGKLLEEAQSRKLLKLELDEKSGGYIISSFNSED